MTKWLVNLFVGKQADFSAPKVRTRVGALSGGVGIVCNFLLFGVKLLVGKVAGSVSITADAMNNLSDATSSVVTLVGFKLAEKPADEDHPYGHARYEYLSGLAVAAMIVVIGFELAKTSFLKILDPTPVALTVPMWAVLAVSVGVKLWLCLFNRKLGGWIGSGTLLATSDDSRNDCITTAAVMAAALIEQVTSWQVDGFMGLGVALFILYSGAMLARDTISPLLGETASPELRMLIVQTISKESKIQGYHDLLVHDYGPGQRFASIHVEMDQKEDNLVCHELIDALERECLQEHNVHLVIHYDPVVTGDPRIEELKDLTQGILQEVDSRITIHDFRMVRGKENSNLIFDIALPVAMMDRKKKVKKYLDEQLALRTDKKYSTVVTFDLAETNQ